MKFLTTAALFALLLLPISGCGDPGEGVEAPTEDPAPAAADPFKDAKGGSAAEEAPPLNAADINKGST